MSRHPSLPIRCLPASLAAVFFSLLAVLLSLPAAADWIVPNDGDPIETQGPWTVDGETLTYTDLDGADKQLALAAVDLEASEATTELKAPKITLYMTSWCGYCRRTSKLLSSIDVAFLEKDIEKDAEARAEYKARAGNYQGIPLVDIDGTIIKGFQATLIHRLATEVKERQSAPVAAGK